MDKESSQVLNKQKLHWEQTYSKESQMFGEEPSQPARNAADLFKKEGKTNILELGGGQGRDTIFFARNSFKVTALDYSKTGIEASLKIKNKKGKSK